jgi:DNA repair exonuclease SbcCD ATPase subunit
MLWKRAPVVPIKTENQDFLGELARQAGEERERVQTLLEEYALERDRHPAPVRKWTVAPKAPPAPTLDLQAQKIEELSARLERVESDMATLVEGLSQLVTTLQRKP